MERGAPGGRMHEIDQLGPAEFASHFATYWGRRRIGIVIDNDAAERMNADPQRRAAIRKVWVAALAAYPTLTHFHLMGTPALTPEIVRAWDAAGDDRPVAPPPPVVGRYAGEPWVRAEVGAEPTIVRRVQLSRGRSRALALVMSALFAAVTAVVLVQGSLFVPALVASLIALASAAAEEVVAIRAHDPFSGLRALTWLVAVVSLVVLVAVVLGVLVPPTPPTNGVLV